MTCITIQENQPGDHSAWVMFDHGQRFDITITNPFDDDAEANLEWYFEEYLRFPFTETVRFADTAKTIAPYGETLFEQVFIKDHRIFGMYQKIPINDLRFEIIGSPEFHALHWETLKDPDQPTAFVTQCPMVRRNTKYQPSPASVRESPTLNVLVVTARPAGKNDVGYRTISRPLVEALQTADTKTNIDILRPGTFEALAKHLEDTKTEHNGAYYHIIHFDTHGALLPYGPLKKGLDTGQILFSPYARVQVAPYDGLKAFLAFETGKPEVPEFVEAGQLADLLQEYRVPIVILNACQSGKQVSGAMFPEDADTRETSLGSRLMDAGVQMVLAMGYSVTVSAAKTLMTALYEQLFQGRDLTTAIRRGRQELHRNKNRRAYFSQVIDLEDWMLPVVYQNSDVALQPRAFTPEESTAYYEAKARRYQAPETTYGFVGRDLDILSIERLLINDSNIVLLRGMGGAGKSTLLHHLASWWQTTGFVDKVWYFGYDEKAHTRQWIVYNIAQELLSPAELQIMPPNDEAQQEFIAERLRANPHLLILDNLESVQGTEFAIQNTLDETEQKRLHSLLKALRGGKTRVLLGSRSGEAWLSSGTFDDTVYSLPGLDDQAASDLAEAILKKNHATQSREDADFKHLMKLLDGYPLLMEVLLANLANQTPKEILEALTQGEEDIDFDSEEKTKSILRCVDYSFSNLDPQAQQLLLCLAPFTSVFDTDFAENYIEQLKKQDQLKHLPFDEFDTVLKQTVDWGLLNPHPDVSGYLQMQPTLAWFLRKRLQDPAQVEFRQAVETAFHLHYDDLGRTTAYLLTSKQPEQRRFGQTIMYLEHENLISAMNAALNKYASVFYIYYPLSLYYRTIKQNQRSLLMHIETSQRLSQYPDTILQGQSGVELADILDATAQLHLELNDYANANAIYHQVLEIWQQRPPSDQRNKELMIASSYHQLGRISQEQHQLEEAQRHYEQALDIFIELDNTYGQANAYHQLGRIAQTQGQWSRAEKHFRNALNAKLKDCDRYSQAITYNQLGNVARLQEQWHLAKQYHQQALDIYIEYMDYFYEAVTFEHIGQLEQDQKHWDQAEKYYQKALAIQVRLGIRQPQAATYYMLGKLAQDQHNWQQAEQYYNQSLTIDIEYLDRYSTAITLYNLGFVYQELGAVNAAKLCYQQALVIYTELGEHNEQPGIYYGLGSVEMDLHQWQQADLYYQKAMEIYTKSGNKFQQARTFGQLGKLAKAQSMHLEASQYLAQALGIFNEINDKHNANAALRHLVRLWKECGDDAILTAVGDVLDMSMEDVRKAFEQVD